MASNSKQRSSSSDSRPSRPRPSQGDARGSRRPPAGRNPREAQRRPAPANGRRTAPAPQTVKSGQTPKAANVGKTDRVANGGGHKSKAKRWIIAIVIVLAALGVSYLVLSHTDVFKITSIHVEGSTRLSDDYLTAQVAIPDGTNLLNVDTGAVQSRLESNPWVKSVSVHREFPNTLGLEITENFPAAVVQIDPSEALGAIQYWLISSDGVWMSQVSSTGVDSARQLVIDSTSSTSATTGTDSATTSTTTSETTTSDTTSTTTTSETTSGDGTSTDTTAQETEPSVCEDSYLTVEELSTVPIISGLATGVVPEAGSKTTDDGLLNALDIVSTTDEDFRDQIATITASSDDTTSVVLKSGVEIAFGDATDIESKIAVVNELMAKYPGEISYINVRVVSRPSWRVVGG